MLTALEFHHSYYRKPCNFVLLKTKDGLVMQFFKLGVHRVTASSFLSASHSIGSHLQPFSIRGIWSLPHDKLRTSGMRITLNVIEIRRSAAGGKKQKRGRSTEHFKSVSDAYLQSSDFNRVKSTPVSVTSHLLFRQLCIRSSVSRSVSLVFMNRPELPNKTKACSCRCTSVTIAPPRH